ncbi:MAG: branched-chain amino acid ABC transporter permease [Burkholderiales bacterium]|nr:branched-chain amino acid ABC transporter permease [Burkholderiales bacterium]
MTGTSASLADPGRWPLWAALALLFAGLPWLFDSGFSITLLSQMGVMIVFALSYNMLFGQGGMLSFGHAVYSGLGAFFTIHALNWASAGALPMSLPLPLLPLAGGLAGAAFGVLFGYVTTRKAGTPFAMITLGIGELVFAAAAMLPSFFGGEGGISGNRVLGRPWLGFSFGPAIEVYYLIAVWCFACIAAMYAFTRTPLGRIVNAVRDNPERAEFIGYDTRRVRWLVLIASAFFAGIAGGLAAINFEIVTAENLSLQRSAAALLATVIGGSAIFIGPALGAILFVFFAVALSEYTQAWQLYLGLFFVLMVMFVPGGVAALLAAQWRAIGRGRFTALLAVYASALLIAAPLMGGAVLLIELGYRLSLASEGSARLSWLGVGLDAASPWSWALAATLLAAGVAALAGLRRPIAERWRSMQPGQAR